MDSLVVSSRQLIYNKMYYLSANQIHCYRADLCLCGFHVWISHLFMQVHYWKILYATVYVVIHCCYHISRDGIDWPCHLRS